MLFCEGGPQSPVSQFWSYRWNFQIMAANDYIIIAPNRRGLPGFGMEWLEQISGDYGGQCMKDYLSAIDDISKEPYVDTDRLGCVGASFGGFSVYWLAGHHNKRFKAFIAHDGIEERVLVLVYKHKTEKYREPHQHQRTADEPLPQAHHTHPHQLQSRHSQEHENQERRYTETIIYQIAGQLRTAATGVVLHPIIGGNQLLRTASVNDALVCRYP